MEETVIVQSQELQQLIQNKLAAAGLSEEHAAIVAEHLVFADASGIHSHGAVRVDYYAERIAKGGMNRTPQRDRSRAKWRRAGRRIRSDKACH